LELWAKWVKVKKDGTDGRTPDCYITLIARRGEPVIVAMYSSAVCLWQTPSLSAAAASADVEDSGDVETRGEDDVRYRELYSRCWHRDRDVRPSAVQLVDLLSYWSSSV